MATRKRTNRGRDLRHTETQAGIDVTRYVAERGKTPGMLKLGAVPASSPRLRRRFPRTNAGTLPIQAPDGTIGSMVTYFVDPTVLRQNSGK